MDRASETTPRCCVLPVLDAEVGQPHELWRQDDLGEAVVVCRGPLQVVVLPELQPTGRRVSGVPDGGGGVRKHSWLHQ